jgi:hypothetical protein
MAHAALRMRLLLGPAILLFFATAAWAQYGAGIEGTVSDKSGAVISGADVTATNQATGVSRKSTTGSSGFYRIPGLTPGAYEVVVQAPSFKESSTSGVVVPAEALRGFDVTLEPAQAQENVTVSAETEELQTEGASVTGTITTKEVLELPQFGRDPYNLLRLAPGVFSDASRQGNGNSLTIPQQVGPGGSNSQIFQTENQPQAIANGQRVSANNYMLDGVSVNSLSHGGTAVITPNQESVQEVVVASESYSAQDGRNSGAQVKTISKSGTNTLHGSGFTKFNDKGLNAYNKFYGPTNITISQITCETQTPDQFKIFASHCPTRVNQRYRQFGGSLGGRIIKNKLFFFGSYEGVRLTNTTVARDVKLETPQFEQYVVQNNPGSIAAKLFSTPGIAPRIATVTKEVDCCSLIPGYGIGKWYVPGTGIGQAVGNGPDGIPDWGIFDLTLPNSSSGDQYNGRVDYTRGNNQFFVSSYIVRLNQLGGGQRPLEDVTLKPHNYVGTIGWTRTLGATMLNEARGNFTRFDFDQRQPVGQTNFGIPQIRVFDFDAGGLGDPGRIIGIAQASTTPAAVAQNTFAFADTFSWIRNRHAWKFGVEIRREQNNNNQPGSERPDYQFRGLLNLANDACCFFEGVGANPTTGGPPNGQRYFRTGDYAVFAQDDWKIKPTLTLNLGLRWEYFSPDTEAKSILSNYIFGSQGFINGVVCAPVVPFTPCPNGNQLYEPDRNNFGPRIGFAWSPGKHQGKVVFRGGFGLLYNRYFGDVFDNVRQDTPFFAQVSTCCFFDPRDASNNPIVGPPPRSGIQYALGSSTLATSYPANPNLSHGVAPDGALCGDPTCSATGIIKVDLFGALPHTPNPYVFAFSYEAQIEPIKDLVAKIGYQGSRSRKLVRTIDLNRIIPGDTFDGNRDEVQSASADGVPCGPSNPACPTPVTVGNNRFKRIFFPLPDVNASFDAMVLHLTRRFSHGFQLDSTYTWSHSIDTTSYEIGAEQTDPSNQIIDRANSDYDVRNNFVLSALWELPFLRTGHGLLSTVAGGWTLSGIMSKHSGFPFSALLGSCDTNHDRNGDGECPDLPFKYAGGIISSPSKQDWINGVFPNPAASFPGQTVIPPPPSVKGPGCRCRNIFTGPGYTSVDMTLAKNFKFPKMPLFGEASNLEIRGNFFNLFNILNLTPLIPATAPTDILNTGSFGRSSDGLAGRVIELQVRFSF